MRYVTLQGYNLITFTGPIKLGLGTYKDYPEIIQKQQNLYEIIQEDQVIWCTQSEPVLVGCIGHFIHDIDVDSRDIVAVVDGLIWCHIIKIYGPRFIPREEHMELRFQVSTSEANDYDVALRRAEDEYLAANLPTDLWSGVIKPEVTKKSDQLLLKFPFTYSIIANVDEVTEVMAERGHR